MTTHAIPNGMADVPSEALALVRELMEQDRARVRARIIEGTVLARARRIAAEEAR